MPGARSPNAGVRTRTAPHGVEVGSDLGEDLPNSHRFIHQSLARLPHFGAQTARQTLRGEVALLDHALPYKAHVRVTVTGSPARRLAIWNQTRTHRTAL